jgi:hypothetical protein
MGRAYGALFLLSVGCLIGGVYLVSSATADSQIALVLGSGLVGLSLAALYLAVKELRRFRAVIRHISRRR